MCVTLQDKLQLFVANYGHIITFDMLIDLCDMIGVPPSKVINEFTSSKVRKKSKTLNNTLESDREYLTVPEVAALFRIKALIIREWIRRGKLNAVKIGREYRVRQQDIEDFNKSRCTKL